MAYTCSFCGKYEAHRKPFGDLPAVPRVFAVAHKLQGKKNIDLCDNCWWRLVNVAKEEELLYTDLLLNELYDVLSENNDLHATVEERKDELEDANDKLAEAERKIDGLIKELNQKEDYVAPDDVEEMEKDAYESGYADGISGNERISVPVHRA